MDALTLAADCLEEAREIDPAVRRMADEQVIAGLESSDPARQRLAAEVQLARRVKSLQPIDDNHQRITNWLSKIDFDRKKIRPRKLDLHILEGSVKLMMNRDTGQVRAWEGIRLVRETEQEQEQEVNSPGMDDPPHSRAA